MPEYYIRENLKDSPEKAFSRVGFSGDHSRTIALVKSAAYQVGAVNYKVWEDQLAAGDIDTNEINVIWTTPTYPDYQWSVRGDLDQQFGEGFTERLTQALLNLKDPDILAAFPRHSFIPATNDDYLPIKKTAVAIGLIDPQ